MDELKRCLVEGRRDQELLSMMEAAYLGQVKNEALLEQFSSEFIEGSHSNPSGALMRLRSQCLQFFGVS